MKRGREGAEEDSEGDEEVEAEEGGADADASPEGEDGQEKPSKRSRRNAKVTLSSGKLVSVNVRNHVNPLLPHFNKPVAVPFGGDWSKAFADPSLPIVLDIGCAKGHFCLQGATRFPAFNWIGLEIREALTVRGNEWAKEQGLGNLQYLWGNASASMSDLMRSLPAGRLQRVTIQCPDPVFKKKQQKRRMVNESLVKDLAHGLASDGFLFVQSDVEQVSMQMVDQIMASGNFERVHAVECVRLPTADGKPEEAGKAIDPLQRTKAANGRDFQDKEVCGGEWAHKGAGAVDGQYHWLTANPLGLMSERESSTISRELPMFRAVFRPSTAGGGGKAEATGGPWPPA